MAGSYQELLVWQQAMELVETVYKATDLLPKSEDYALKSQIRRAAVSIPSNIAEGTARGSRRDFKNFLRIAKGSGRELETQIEIAKRVGFFSDTQAISLNDQAISISKLLTLLIRSIDQ